MILLSFPPVSTMVKGVICRNLGLCLLALSFLPLNLVGAQDFQAGKSVARNGHPFPVPAGLNTAIEFWKQIFTRYRRSEIVFYDSKDQSKIYKVVNIGKSRRLRSLIRRERKRIANEHGLKSVRRVMAQRGVKERFISGLQQSQRYLDQMQEIFRKRELPVELAYLPLIESSFQLNARSRAGAVGIWQFMRRTGKRYLRITSTVDERKDPLESTRAAASLLEENFEMFNDWPLAITAYNHGRAGIQRAVMRVGSGDLTDLIKHDKSRRFGVASKNFYAEFVAAVEVALRDREYFPEIEYDLPRNFQELKLDQPIALSVLLRFAVVSRREFLSWNPALSRNIRLIPKWYRVKIPSEKIEIFAEAHQRVVNGPWVNHRVARGETLSHIAMAYRISIREIQSINGLSNINLITVGQQLKLPKP